MAASKRSLLCLFLVFQFIGVYAQLKKVSIKVSNKPVTEILRLVEAQTGIYFSYDSEIFRKEPLQSLNIINATSEAVLDKILLPKFSYTLVGEYIVINPVKSKAVKEAVNSIGARGQPTRLPVVDTIFIEKIVVRYDTQKIVQHIQITDTVFVNKVKPDRKNLKPVPVKKTIALIPAISIGTWNRISIKGVRATSYNHVLAGLSIEIPVNKVTLTAGAGYSYLFKNFSYPSVFSSGSKNDSSFFPKDTVETRYTSDRINQLGFLSSHVGVRYSKKIKKIELAFEIGTSFYVPVRVDEKALLRDGTLTVYDRKSHSIAINSLVRLPLNFYLSNSLSIVMSPYFEYGLNQDYKNAIDQNQSKRYLYGLTIGLCKK